jgi:mannosyltransferase
MIEVLPEFAEFTAVIAGLCQPQFEAFKAELVHKIDRAGLSDRILFIGEIPPQQVQDWYANCLIAVACPRYEGYGLTVLEGMACECAVVASDTGIFRKIIKHNEVGHLIDVGDARQLANKLRSLLEEPFAALSFGIQGRHFIAAYYSTQFEAENVNIEYRKLF